MKEAQSPKNVESDENLYKCDPSTDHFGPCTFIHKGHRRCLH